ncbi:MAG TPA: hypothetical protein PLD47_18590, partial [Aggregatilineales bacterium]|nr:hypothetical protein [Aggregatilineales bacterium]
PRRGGQFQPAALAAGSLIGWGVLCGNAPVLVGGLFLIESADGGTIAYWLRRAQKDRKGRSG